MKYILALFLVIVSSLASAETRYIYSPGDGYLNMRQGPGTKYSIIKRMYNGESAEVLSRSGNWLKVRHQSGSIGWGHKKYLIARSVSVSGETRYVYSSSDGYLNLRRGPSTENSIIKRMYNGESVSVLGKNGNWINIRHQSGTQGWAYGKYLVTNRPSTTYARPNTSSETGLGAAILLLGIAAAIVGSDSSASSSSSGYSTYTAPQGSYVCKVTCTTSSAIFPGNETMREVSVSVQASSSYNAKSIADDRRVQICRDAGLNYFATGSSCR